MGSLHKNTSTKVLFLGLNINGIQDHSVLARVKGGHGDFTDDDLIDVRDVLLGLSEGDEPFLSGFPLDVVLVGEGPAGTELEGFLVVQDNGGLGLDDFFVDVGDVGTFLADDPFFASLSLSLGGIDELLLGSQAEGLVRTDDGGAHDFDDLDFDAGDVGGGSGEEPFVSGSELLFALLEIAKGTEFEGGEGGDDLEGGDFAVEGFAGEEGEWFLFKTDFFVSVSKFDLAVLIENRLSFVISLNRIANNTIMTRRNDNHRRLLQDHSLMVHHRERLRTRLDSRDVRIVIQDMNIIERLQTNNRPGHGTKRYKLLDFQREVW